MTETEFRAEMQKLEEVYGVRFFPRPRVEHLWKSFGRLPWDVFKTIVDRVIAENMSVPSIERIVETAKELLAEIRAREAEINGPFDKGWKDCAWCKNQGFRHARHKKLGTTYLFGCPACKRAERLKPEKRQLVLWAKAFETDYELEQKISKSHERRSPWPRGIEGIMLQIEDGRSTKFPREFQTSLNMARLTEAEAWTLYEAFVEKNFHDPEIVEFLKGRSDEEILGRLDHEIENQKAEVAK